MAYDGHLKFDTKIDEAGFKSGITKLGNLAQGGLKVIGGAIAGISAATSAGAIAGLNYNAVLEEYQVSFEVMTGSAQKAEEVLNRLTELGASTPFEMTGLAETTQLLMNYGFTADDAIDKMKMLGDISQGNADKLNRVAMAYGQMSSAGKVSLEDVKQMIEAGFNPLQEISEATGESMASLYDRISDGTLAVDEITASMERATSEGGKYFQSMEKQSKTFNGMISTLKDNAMQLLGDVVEPISKAMTEELLPSAIDAIEQLQKAFEEQGTQGLIEAGSKVVSNLVLGITENTPALIDTAVEILNHIIIALTENIDGIASAGGQILTTLVNGIAMLMPNLGQMALQLILSFSRVIVDNLPFILDAGLEMIKALAFGIIDNLPVLIEQIPIIINDFFEAINSFLPEIIAAGFEIIVALGIGLIKAIPTIIANLDEILFAIVHVLSGFSLLQHGRNIIKGLGDGLKEKIGAISDIARSIATTIYDKIVNTDWIQLGKDLVAGIGTGIKKGAGAIADAAKNAAKNALKSAKDFLGIHSPSTVFRDEVGRYMAEGMGVGFEENLPVDDMNKSLDESISRLQNAVDIDTSSIRPASTSVLSLIDEYDKEQEDREPNIYEIHVHTHLDGREMSEEIVQYMDEDLGEREKLKERGNA